MNGEAAWDFASAPPTRAIAPGEPPDDGALR